MLSLLGGLEQDQQNEEEKVLGLEKLLGAKLAEFLDADYTYTIAQIPSSIRPHLYKGPATTGSSGSSDGAQELPSKPPLTKAISTGVLPVHLAKGGKYITEYLTYDW